MIFFRNLKLQQHVQNETVCCGLQDHSLFAVLMEFGDHLTVVVFMVINHDDPYMPCPFSKIANYFWYLSFSTESDMIYRAFKKSSNLRSFRKKFGSERDNRLICSCDIYLCLNLNLYNVQNSSFMVTLLGTTGVQLLEQFDLFAMPLCNIYFGSFINFLLKIELKLFIF